MIDRLQSRKQLQTVGTRKHRRWSLPERMNGQYWRIARRRRVLTYLSQAFRDNLIISAFQYEMTITDLTRLRRAVEHAYHFYSTLDEDGMKRIQPWGAITKLADFEAQITELLLYVIVMQQAADQEQVFIRVQVHLIIRQLFPVLLTSFEDLVGQLGALPGKAQAMEETRQ